MPLKPLSRIFGYTTAGKVGPVVTGDHDEPAPMVHLSTDFIRAKEYLEAIVVSTSDAIITTDTRGRVIYFSPGAERMLGSTNLAMSGRPARDLYGKGRQEARLVMRLLRKNGTIENHETVLVAEDGRHIHVSMSASLLKDRTGSVIGTLGISKDITERIALEKRLRELSITDDLTGLYNKRHFYERLSQEANRSQRQGYRLTMILIDLDGFKSANDKWGHLVGDSMLKDFADAINQSIRKEVDSAYRYGGDEFVVILPGSAAAQARTVVSRIQAAAREAPRPIAFSYGIAALPASGSLPEFVRLADSKMFKMKATRKHSRRR